jgi:predicted kinase
MKAFLMCGAPGAGKTTYAKKLATLENAVVISGDDIRAELYGSAEIQSNWFEIWDRIDELVSEMCGMPVILDGTFYRKSYREEAVTLLSSYGYTDIEVVVINPTLETCLKRNRERSRNVPEYVIKEMHNELQRSLKGLDSEPFSRLNYVF